MARIATSLSPLLVAAILSLGVAGCSRSSHREPTIPAPRGVTAVPGGPDRVGVDWEEVQQAATYNIYWSANSGVTKETGNLISGVGPPHIHLGLVQGTTYHYAVASVAGPLESDLSSEVSATPDGQGVLDTGFGGGGWVAPGTGAGGSSHDYAYDITEDTAGRIVVVGSSNNAASNPDMVLWRFNADGSPDLTLNGQGWVVYGDAAGGGSIDNGMGVTLDGSGRILVTVYSWHAAGNYDMVVWACQPDGSLDPGFGSGGVVVQSDTAGSGFNEMGYGITLDGSGKVLVVGQSEDTAGIGGMVIWRLNADGGLDTSFAGQGWVLHHNAGGGNGPDSGFGIALDGAGKLLVAGQSWTGAGSYDVAVWRYHADGSVDTGFGGQGWVVLDSSGGGGSNDFGRALLLTATGKVRATGSSWQSPLSLHDVAIWGIGSDGVPDGAFGTGGVVLHDGAAGGGSDDRSFDICGDLFGRIYLTGFSISLVGDKDMVTWRFNPDGTLDTTYGGQGWVQHHQAAGGGSDDEGRALTLDATGRILVAGSSRNAQGDFDIVVWRLR